MDLCDVNLGLVYFLVLSWLLIVKFYLNCNGYKPLYMPVWLKNWNTPHTEGRKGFLGSFCGQLCVYSCTFILIHLWITSHWAESPFATLRLFLLLLLTRSNYAFPFTRIFQLSAQSPCQHKKPSPESENMKEWEERGGRCRSERSKKYERSR